MYVNKFSVWHKKFGPAQNILGPVKGQGIWHLYLKEFSVGYETVTIQVVHPEKEFQPAILGIPLKSTKIETNNHFPLRFHNFLFTQIFSEDQIQKSSLMRKFKPELGQSHHKLFEVNFPIEIRIENFHNSFD